MPENLSYRKSLLIVTIVVPILSLIMHLRVFEKDLISYHVWRQTYTQTTIINFFEEDLCILKPRINDRGNGTGIYRMEFPLMQWSFALFYKIFGNHLIISRILSYLIGLLSTLGLFFAFRELFKNNFLAVSGVWALTFSPSFFYYTLNPMPDNLALCFSIWSMAFFLKFYNTGKSKHFLVFIIFLMFSALCKLPFILYYSVLAAYLFFFRKKTGLINIFYKSAIAIFSLIPVVIWYLSAVPNWKGNGIVQGILDIAHNHDELFYSIQHILISKLPELLLNYGAVLFFLTGLFMVFRKKLYKNSIIKIFIVLGISLLAYYIFEMNMIGWAHDYYLFPFMFALFALVVYGIKIIVFSKKKYISVFGLILLIALPVFTLIRMNSRWTDDRPGFNKDLYANKTELRNLTDKKDLCVVGNDISSSIFYYYLDKRGWCFKNDNLKPDSLKIMIQQGAKYMYSDSRKIDESPEISIYFDSLIYSKNSIRVYKLKAI